MKKIVLIGVLLLFLIQIFCIPSTIGSSNSNPLKYYASEDTYVSHMQWQDSYQLEQSLRVRARYGPNSWQSWQYDTLILFDLSALPTGAYILSAELYLYYYAYEDNDPVDRELSIYRLNDPWNTTNVTWYNRPRNAGRITATATVLSEYGWMNWNVTEDVQEYLEGTWENYGWQITDTSEWEKDNIPITVCYSSEAANYKPYLEIKYTFVKPNELPTADAGGPYLGFRNHSILFNASGSYDPEGSIVGYKWDFTIDGIWDTDWLSEPTITHTFNTTGNHTVFLLVKDDNDTASMDSTKVNVSNAPPIANFTYTPTYPIVTDLIRFNSTSNDTDGSIVSYGWNFSDGNYSNETNATPCYLKNGTYIINLTVTDNDGANTSITKELIVNQYRYGDIDGDGILTVVDLTGLMQYLVMRTSISIPDCYLDVNADNEIDYEDWQILIVYLYTGDPVIKSRYCR